MLGQRDRLVRVLFLHVLDLVSSEPSDRLRWYCREPVHTEPTIIHEESFHVTDLGSQLKPVIQKWMENENVRKCPLCGIVAAAKDA